MLLCFAVRAARQLAMIYPPTAADASHPTTYPWDHSARSPAVAPHVVITLAASHSASRAACNRYEQDSCSRCRLRRGRHCR